MANQSPMTHLDRRRPRQQMHRPPMPRCKPVVQRVMSLSSATPGKRSPPPHVSRSRDADSPGLLTTRAALAVRLKFIEPVFSVGRLELRHRRDATDEVHQGGGIEAKCKQVK